MRSIHSLFFIALVTVESSFVLAFNHTPVCLRRENNLLLKCSLQSTDDFSNSLFPPVINVFKQQQQQQLERVESATVFATSIARKQQQEEATQTPAQRKPLVSFEEWQKKQVLVHENDYSRHNNKRKSNAASSNRQQMVDSVDGGFSDDFGSMFEGSNAPMDMPVQGNIIEPTTRKKKGKDKFGDLRMKSLKERFNYASTDCAATVRKANKEAKGANAILYESKDQYLLNKCSADKFVIINLCEPIRIDTIVMANYEFFSSTFKDFRIYVADRYPSKDWQLLGQWQARNTRDLQVFKVDDKSGWPEYIKIEFLSHYGQEYYCPLSLVRVYGMSMMEYYNRVERQGLSDDDNDEDILADEHLWPADVREQIIQPQFDNTNISEPFKNNHQSHDDDEDEDDSLEEVVIPPVIPEPTESFVSKKNDFENNAISENEIENNEEKKHDVKEDKEENTVDSSAKNPDSFERDDNNMTVIEEEETTNKVVTDEQNIPFIDNEKVSSSSLSTQPSPESSGLPSQPPSLPSSSSKLEESSISPELSSSSISSSQSLESFQDSLSFESLLSSSPSTPVISSSSSSNIVLNDNDFPSLSTISLDRPLTDTIVPEAIVTSDSTTNKDEADVSATETTNQEAEKSTEEVRQPKIIVPKEKSTTQESIYKTIMKRLNALEINATLSQRYLDDQNKMLNDVFIDMEKRHQEQLMLLIGHLNETASHKIDSMKRRYEKWYDELKGQTENDMREMTAKISILADQLSFERRISLTQLVIIITIFVFMALSRGTFSTLSSVVVAQEEERKKRQSANQAAALLSTISHSLKPKQKNTNELPPIITKPENPRRHSDDPYFTMSLQEKENEEKSYEGLRIELEPELLSHKLNNVLKQQQQEKDEQKVPLSNETILLSEEERNE